MERVDERKIVRMLSDVASQVEDNRSETARVARQAAQKKETVQQASGLFAYVDPHIEVYTDSGSGGSGSFNAYDTLDFGPYVGATARKAYCYLTVTAVISGSDDPILGVDWLVDGGTDALPLFYYYDQHSLVDDAENYPVVQVVVPLGASRSGQIRTKDSPGTWTYSLKLWGYE